ncbi:MAG: endonuclease/exonuclease/phosphatase family protein, partial [Ignavibacteriales bacterium]
MKQLIINYKLMNKIFLLTASLFAFTVTFSADDDEVLKVMSYNIRVAFDEGENSWNNRKEIVASLIKNYDPDIIGLQEVLKTQLDDLIERLPEYSWVGVGRDDGKMAGEYSAIFFKKERFEILEDSTIWLSDTPEIPSIGWDAAFKRIITWAKIKDRITEKTFHHFNTHFDHKGEMAQLESANLLNDKVAEIAGKNPAVVTGDLNFTPDSKGYQLLVGGRRD